MWERNVIFWKFGVQFNLVLSRGECVETWELFWLIVLPAAICRVYRRTTVYINTSFYQN